MNFFSKSKRDFILQKAVWIATMLTLRLVIHPLRNVRFTQSSDRFPSGPCVIISNHGTFFDPFYIGGKAYRQFRYMCNKDAFDSSAAQQFYLHYIGAYPKKKGVVDVAALKKTLVFLKNKIPVLIFPEGQTTWDGKTQPLYPGIEKVVKKAGVDLVLCRLAGNFLQKPWWATTRRTGPVRIELCTIPASQLADLSTDEIFAKMKSYLQHNDIQWARKNNITYRGHNLASGIEHFLWICPFCFAEDGFSTQANELTCKCCKKHLELDANGFFAGAPSFFRAIDQASSWHHQKVLSKINASSAQTVLCGQSSCELWVEKKGKWRSLGSAKALLSSEQLTCSLGSRKALGFPISEVKSVVIQRKNLCDFMYQNTWYRLALHNDAAMKWVLYLQYLTGFASVVKRGYW